MTCRVRAVESFADVTQLVVLHNRVWKGSVGIVDLLATATECVVAVASDAGVVGYAFVEEDPKRRTVELNDITVDPKHQGRGCGAMMMRHLMARHDAIKLCARARSRKLVRFYERLGFQTEAVYENYYGIGEDALRMAWRRAGR